ncbi:MAG: DUF5647 family protein [bacterium]
MESFKKLTAVLSSDFDKYLLEHLDVGEQIPRNALIVFQVEGNEEYNRWSRELAKKYREKNQNVIFVRVKGLRPSVSRLIEPKLEKVNFQQAEGLDARSAGTRFQGFAVRLMNGSVKPINNFRK